MSIPVLLFASYADALGARRVEVAIRTPCAVSDLVDALRALPGGAQLPPNPLVAINHEWVRGRGVVNAGDEVAVIPPVAGG
jgi:molybdopterin converting factor small subunit